MNVKNNRYKWKKIPLSKSVNDLLFYLIDRQKKKAVIYLYVIPDKFEARFRHLDPELKEVYYKRYPEDAHYHRIKRYLPAFSCDARRLIEGIRMIEEIHGVLDKDHYGTNKSYFRLIAKQLLEKQ